MYRKISQFVLATGIGTLSIIGVSFLKAESEVKAGRSAGIERPNIVMLIADDMGYSDLGVYGSEISTPNIDSLAHEGMILTNFHTGPACSPTRSMLLTGVDNHYAGVGNMLEKLAPSQVGKPNYEGYLNDKVVTLPTLLRDAGYHTYMSGKWHLGGFPNPKTGIKEGFDPYERGFEETFTMLEGAGDHYTMRGFSPVLPINDFTRNGKKVTELPKDFYSTTSFTDQMIEYVDAKYKDGKPFFSYLAYSAPHSPYQAPKELIDKYVPVYEQGWDKLRESRFKRMKELGIIPKYLELPERWPGVGPWANVPPDKQKISAKKMASYAAMIEQLDVEIGRYLQYLKDIGEYDNTIFVFMTDNGADGHNRQETAAYEKWFAEIGVDNSYENLGLRNSFVTRNIHWAQVSATPHWGEKAGHAEGGLTGAFFVSYTGFLDSGQSKAFTSVKDVTPTLLEYAGIAHPGSTYKDRKIYPMTGRSMRPLWEGYSDRIYAKDEPIVFETFGTGDAAVFLGNWKILRQNPEWGDGTWKLYNLEIDPTETNDLSRIYPTLLQNMINEYETYAKEVQIVRDNRVGAE